MAEIELEEDELIEDGDVKVIKVEVAGNEVVKDGLVKIMFGQEINTRPG